ncbi:MAG: hypothetical protein R3D56_00435 [Paracoccaceae bacterium]
MGTDNKNTDTTINLSEKTHPGTDKPANEQAGQSAPKPGQMGDGSKTVDTKHPSGQSK